ncbi:MAG: prolipoprotein diacylglyceryl transferase family protein [Bradymonadaceae bacterium]
METVLQIDPTRMPPYSLWIGVGIWLAFIYAMLMSPAHGVRRVEAGAMLGWCGLGALAGAPVVGAIFGVFITGQSSGTGFSSLGVLLGAVLAAGLAWPVIGRDRWLGLLDVVVPSGLVGLAIGHLGCLFRGCDFGRITEAGWAVEYAQGSGPWLWHQVQGETLPGAAASMATHPFGAYLGAGTLAVVAGGVLWKWRRPQLAPGLIAFATALGYLGARLLVELSREPVFMPEWGRGVHLLHPLLAAGIVGVLVLWYGVFQPGRPDE